MTHVADSSSDLGSSLTVDQAGVFDISTETGLLALLRAIHRSALKQKTKNDLRDTLFALPSDDEGKAVVVRVLQENGFAARFADSFAPSTAAMKAGKSQASMSRLGRARSAPRFSAASVVSAPAPVVERTDSEPKAEPTPAMQPPHVEPTPAVEEEKAVVTPAPVEVPTPEVSAPTTPTTPTTKKVEPTERIKEIKRLVNEKVGNPITLIDVDNRIGREYMNALLSAMKATNGGRPEEVDAAMVRLESAYVEAIKVAENAPPPETQTDKFVKSTQAEGPVAQKIIPPQSPTSAPVTEITSQVTEPAVPMSGFESVARVSESEPMAEPAPKVESVAIPVKINVSSATAHSTAPQAAPSTDETHTEEETSRSVPIVNKMTPVAAPLSKPTLVETPSMVPTTTPVSAAANPEARLMSVAKEEQLQNLMRQNQAQNIELQKQDEEQMRATTDPLLLHELTAGLKQLLSEWSLFKSSGFFGTGPGGIDHPLYKKMQNLMMAAVIAGRFEGATPQVKQSITDYMNGWRYEEGIVHEHSETFEHYLRRVIRHILDNKTNSKKLP